MNFNNCCSNSHVDCCINNPNIPPRPQAPSVVVNSTTTGAPGSNAMVINSGTCNNVRLDFIIPRGNTGPMPTLQIGRVITGYPGTQASVNITPIRRFRQ